MSSSQIDVYYSTIYPSICPKNEDFIASWQGLATFSHSFAVILLPLYIFGAFCIIKKTPVTMQDVKYYLLNLHFWSSFVDILACSLITPYFYFPAIAGIPIGLLQVFEVPVGLQIYIGLECVLAMAVSMVALFENRFTTLVKKYRISPSTKYIYYGGRAFIMLTYILPAYFFIPDQEAAKLNFLSVVPCPTEEYFYSDVYFFIDDSLILNIYYSITLFFVFEETLQVVIFTIGCAYFIFIAKDKLTSKKTKQLQARFFYSTIVQVALPFLFLVIPILSLFITVQINYYNQSFFNICVLTVSIHGFVSTIVMLSIHKRYRVYTLQLICRKTAKNPDLQKFSQVGSNFRY